MLSEKIKFLRKKSGLSQRQVAEKLFISQQAYAKYETGTASPSLDVLKAMSEFFEVDTNFILGIAPKSARLNIKKIPVLGRVQAGIPMEAIEEILDYEEIRPSDPNAEYFALKIIGDSMEPRIYDGDIVIVQKQPDVNSGEIAVVLIDGNDATCKKIIKQGNGITLVALNIKYDPLYFSNKDVNEFSFVVLGKVVEIRSKL